MRIEALEGEHALRSPVLLRRRARQPPPPDPLPTCRPLRHSAARLALAEIDKDTSGSSLLLSPALPPRSDREVASMHYERVMEQLRRSSTDGAEQHNDSSRLFANLAQIGSPEGAQQLTEL